MSVNDEDAPLIGPIEGYEIKVIQTATGIAKTMPLSLNKVGGAHITNPDDLIMMIEDAVFTREQADE